MDSGKPSALRLHEAAHDADIDAHARPEGRDAGRALRELPSAVHLANIAARHAGERVSMLYEAAHMQDPTNVIHDLQFNNFRAQCTSQISQHAMRERG